jgi:uncharacterized protein (DUF885 family)
MPSAPPLSRDREGAVIYTALSILLIGLAGCGTKPITTDFDKLSQDLIYGSLAFSPVTATATGYHTHNGIPLDELLDDYSPQGMAQQRGFYQSMQARVAAVDAASLDREQKADLEIMKDSLGLSLLELNTIQSYKHNPTIYVELAGNALFNPYMLNYAPKEKRFQQITRRLEKMPALFEQAKSELVDAPEIWNKVAQEENDGNIELIDKTLRAEVPEAQKADYNRAAGDAIASLRGFNTFLKDTLSKKTPSGQISDWRLGKDNYAKKFQYTLHTGKAPEQLLAEAEAELKAVREEMVKLATPKTVKQALDDIAKQHTTSESYLDAARKTLEQATAFVREKGLVTLSSRSNLQVVETPAFLRGIYGVGGFDPAPALEPQLGAFYWITPIPKDWPKERAESKLREYNNYGLQELTVHEAMPGHYVQFEYANDVQPQARRLLRSVFSNTPYVEGWAFYTQQMMSDEGYLNNSKELRMSFYKQALRALANTILDVRLQTMGMTEQQALDLMMNDTFQEKEEATAKYQRAQLSSCQLPTYFAGWKGWLEAREQFKQKQGSAYTLRDFHDRALKESAVPLPVLEQLLQ